MHSGRSTYTHEIFASVEPHLRTDIRNELIFDVVVYHHGVIVFHNERVCGRSHSIHMELFVAIMYRPLIDRIKMQVLRRNVRPEVLEFSP